MPLKTKTGRENKSLAEQVVVRLFTGHAGKISQVPLFAKAGLVFKTVTINGVRMYRQNVWIKGTELADRLERLMYL